MEKGRTIYYNLLLNNFTMKVWNDTKSYQAISFDGQYLNGQAWLMPESTLVTPVF